MDLTQKYHKHKAIVYREEDDGAFLFDPATGNLKYMNRSGRETFLMLSEQQDVTQVIDGLLGLFPGVDSHQIANDLEVFLIELEKNGFITALNRE